MEQKEKGKEKRNTILFGCSSSISPPSLFRSILCLCCKTSSNRGKDFRVASYCLYINEKRSGGDGFPVGLFLSVHLKKKTNCAALSVMMCTVLYFCVDNSYTLPSSFAGALFQKKKREKNYKMILSLCLVTLKGG